MYERKKKEYEKIYLRTRHNPKHTTTHTTTSHLQLVWFLKDPFDSHWKVVTPSILQKMHQAMD